MATPQERVMAARTTLLFDHPFFAMLALRLKVVESTQWPTACTNGQILGYNPKFVESLTHDELLFVIAHEVLHCALGHMWRKGTRQMKKWNFAADYAINPVLVNAGFKAPKDILLDPQYDGFSAEWIYDRLPDMPDDDEGDDEGRPGTGGTDVMDAPPPVDGSEMTESDWKEATSQAAAAAKARGNLPASMERFIADAVKPKVDWRSVLHRFVQERAQDDYTFRKPNRRYLQRGFILPSLYSEAVGPIAVAIDTSGSVDDVTLSQFAAELRSVVDDVKPSQVVVMYCDAKIHRTDVFARGEAVTIDPVGGGGTSHVPVMDEVDAMDEEPVCLICLTDLYTEHRAAPPVCPVLWATIGSTEAPYGEIVEVK